MGFNIAMVIALWNMGDVHEDNYRVKERGGDARRQAGREWQLGEEAEGGEEGESEAAEFRSYYGAVNSASLMETIRQVPEVLHAKCAEEEDNEDGACIDDEDSTTHREEGSSGEGEDPFDEHRAQALCTQNKSENSALLPVSRNKQVKLGSPNKAPSVASKTSSAPSSINHVCKMVF
jgi:hypothetical protein